MAQLLLDLLQVANALSVSRRTVQGLVYAGALPSVKIGRSRRVALADLEVFVAKLRNENDRDQARFAVVTGGSRVSG